MNDTNIIILALFLMLTLLHGSQGAKFNKDMLEVSHNMDSKPNAEKSSFVKGMVVRDYQSRCGHLRQPLTSWCSGRWELHNPSITADFTTCTTNEFYIDNGNNFSVRYRLQCGWSPAEHNTVGGNTCGVLNRTPSSSMCYVSTLSSGWIGVWTCCV